MENIKIVTSAKEMEAVMSIRREVFIEEQAIPEEEEIDDKDEESKHYLLNYSDTEIGSARVRYLDDNVAIVERVAILSGYRGYGFGKKLMLFILEDIKNTQQIKIVKLGAQAYAIPFYENLGFQVCSDEYIEAGIKHKYMQVAFENRNSEKNSKHK